jgi:hypothetical protein
LKKFFSLVTLFGFSGVVRADEGVVVQPKQGLPPQIWTDMIAVFAFGLLLILLMIVGYKLIDWALRRVDFDAELSKGNTAVGIVVASIIASLAYAVSQVIVAVIN